MRSEYSAGAVVFRRKNGRIEFLLLRHDVGHWSHPKGHIEPGETASDAMKRELEEETSITNFEMVEPQLGKIEYNFRDKDGVIHKQVEFSLIQVPASVRVQLSPEHIDYGWFSPSRAIQQATYEGDKQMIEEAIKILKDKYQLH